ncbi:MAG: right-handed parallel beta-helix repeat-containing protein [bacterium]|nr:right-handed parallel beta-helix repeat-containing protein [bacterium]
MRNLILIACLFTIAMLPASGAYAGAVYVDVEGDDGATGGPGDPFATIQHAVGAVASGDTILLYDGTFNGTGNRNIQLGPRALTLASVSGVPESCVIDCGGLDGVVFADSSLVLTDTLGIEGIRFTNAATAVTLNNGLPQWPGLRSPRGCRLRSLMFDAVGTAILTRNHAVDARDLRIQAAVHGLRLVESTGRFEDLHVSDAGQGVSTHAFFQPGDMHFYAGTFVRNGHGLFIDQSFMGLHLTDCRVDSNTVAGLTMRADELAPARLLRTTIGHNQGFGLRATHFAYLDGDDSEIHDNAGAGIELAEHTHVHSSMDNMVVRDNGGWGVDFDDFFGAGLVVNDSEITGNGLGGCRVSGSDLTVNGSLIADNSGTAILALPKASGTGPWEFDGSTMARNAGRGLVILGQDATVTNLLIAANDSAGIAVPDTTGLNITCTDIWGNAGGNWTGDLVDLPGTGGNLEQDPQFCRTGDNPYALVLSSPCSGDNNPCGTIGRYEAACEGPFLEPADLHQYDPATGAYTGPYQNVPVTMEGVVYVEPGLYSPGGGGYLQDVPGGVNFWHFLYPEVIERGDLIRITGPVWPDGSGQVYIGNFAVTVLDSNLTPYALPLRPGDLLGDLGWTAAFLSMSGVVDSLTADRFVLRDGAASIEVRRTAYTGVSFASVVAGQDWTVRSPVFRSGTTMWLSPRESGDLFLSPFGDLTNHYVAVDGDDGDAGTSADPLATMAEAFTRAAAGDTVSLLDGVHGGDGNRDLILPDYQVVVRSASGNADSCMIDLAGSAAAPHRLFTANANQDTMTVVEGLTITNGWSADDGGAVLMTGAAVMKIADCIFRDNHAESSGGAIDREWQSDHGILGGPVIERCLFEGNSASSGGACAIYAYTEPRISDSEFRLNTAGSGGGAVVLGFEVRGLIEQSDFVDNVSSGIGGALDVSMEQQSVIVACLFLRNSADQGGAVANGLGFSKKSSPEAGNRADKSYADFSDCVFQENTANEGGVYYGWYKTFNGFVDCAFVDNSATVRGGVATELLGCEVIYDGCLFVGNSAPIGGSLYRDDLDDPWALHSSRISSCTFVGSDAPQGGTIFVTGVTEIPEEGDPRGYLIDSTVIANGTDGAAVLVQTGRHPVFTCTDIHGNAGGDWTGAIASLFGTDGNFSADPCFCDPDASNYTLCATSPCLPGNHPDGADCGIVGRYGQGCGTPSDVDVPEATPTSFRLVGARPNPFNPQTTIVYELPEPATVTLRIYDPRGRLIQVLEDRVFRGSGRHEAVWLGRDLRGRTVATGVYLCRLEAGRFRDTRRMTLIR